MTIFSVARRAAISALSQRSHHASQLLSKHGAPVSLVGARWYRGDSGEMQSRSNVVTDDVSRRELELLAVAEPKADAIYERHVRMPDDLDVRKKRLVYRAKQRGWLEVDLLLGTWANQNVPNLTKDELDQFEEFVNLETIDIYNVITLRSDVPEEMKREGGSGLVEKIQEWARASPLGKANPEKYASVKHDNNLI